MIETADLDTPKQTKFYQSGKTTKLYDVYNNSPGPQGIINSKFDPYKLKA